MRRDADRVARRGGRAGAGGLASELGELVELEHQIGDGPGLHALRQDAPVSMTDIAGDRRWPGPGERRSAGAARVRGGVRARVRGDRRGHRLRSAPRRARSDGRAAGRRARPAGRLVVRLRAGAREPPAGGAATRVTMAGRESIEQAKGMIMQALGVGPEEAFAELRRTSQNAHMKLERWPSTWSRSASSPAADGSRRRARSGRGNRMGEPPGKRPDRPRRARGQPRPGRATHRDGRVAGVILVMDVLDPAVS